MVSVYNVFRKEDAQIRDSELKKLGVQEELAGSLTYPIMTVNGNIYFGTDSIRSSIREAYLTAGEDLFVYGRGVYDPTKNETLKQQLEDYKLEKAVRLLFISIGPYARSVSGPAGRFWIYSRIL